MGKTDRKVIESASLCTLCDPAFPCGVNLHIKDGVIIKAEGNAAHPYSGGKLCFEGAALRKHVYSPDRIKLPLKRAEGKGGQGFERISWDEALNTIARKLQDVKDTYGANAVAFSCGGKYIGPYLREIARAFGTSSFMDFSNQAARAVTAAQTAVFGIPVIADTQQCKCLLVWGLQSFNANIQDIRRIIWAKARGCQVILINSSVSPTEALADIYLMPKAGTEHILALAIAHVIVSEGLHDERIWDCAKGFDDFAEHVSEYKPEAASIITGVSPESIRKAAKVLASSKPASLLVPCDPDIEHVNASGILKTLCSLMAITGNFNVWEGILPWDAQSGMSFGMTPEKFMSAIDSSSIKALFAHDFTLRELPGGDIMGRLRKELDFMVFVGSSVNDTCKYADIILPSCSCAERGDTRVYPGGETVSVAAAITPLYESRPEVDILLQLSEKLGIEPEAPNFDSSMKTADVPDGPINLYPIAKEDFSAEVGEVSSQIYPYILRISFDFPTFVSKESLFISKIEGKAEDVLILNPEDAQGKGIKPAEAVMISTSAGNVEAVVMVSDMIQQGTVYLYAPKVLDGGNPLLGRDRYDPDSGIFGYKSMMCEIQKTPEEGDTKP